TTAFAPSSTRSNTPVRKFRLRRSADAELAAFAARRNRRTSRPRDRAFRYLDHSGSRPPGASFDASTQGATPRRRLTGMTQKGAKVVKDGIEVVQGTPTGPITRSTLFLRLWKAQGPKNNEVTRAALFMVRPGRGEYVVKELIPDMELGP